MIPDIVGQSTGRLDQRFFVAALLPTAVFVPATVGVVLYARDDLPSVASWYTRQTTVSQVLASLGASAVVWFLATMLDSQSRNVVRLYEGYPLVRLFEQFERLLNPRQSGEGAFESIGVAAHRYRRQRLRDRVQAASRDSPDVDSYDEEPDVHLYDSYPQDHTRLMPTTLGNILRAAEDYGYHRYGFDSIHLWPRLAAVLPDVYLDDIEMSILKYQTPLMISFGSCVLAFGSLALLWSTIATGGFVIIFLGSWTMSWVAYRLSFGAAKAYGDHLRTAIDLYRTDLLERWWPELLAIEDDRQRLKVLRHFVVTGEKVSVNAFIRKRPHEQPTDATSKATDVASPDAGAAPITAPARGFRVSWIVVLLVVLVVLAGTVSLNRRIWVLVADAPIGAFQKLSGQVTPTLMRRGSVGNDAVAAATARSAIDRSAVHDRITLRRLADGEVIRGGDVSPQNTTPGVVVELQRRRAQVEALDLQPGDDLFLEGEPLTDVPVNCALTTFQPTTNPATSTSTPTTEPPIAREVVVPVVEGQVLAVVDGDVHGERSVLLRIEVSGATACLGNLDKVQIARGPA